ncbi:MAG: hypothetical protein U1E18_15960 [Brevundimonas sp.]|nr:hypothetical protein [Brevundimonas sp.]
MKTIKRFENALVLEGLSFREAYVEGRMWIALEFGAKAGAEPEGGRFIAVGHNKGKAADAAARRLSIGADDVQPVDCHCSVGADEEVVLVGDVEPIDAVQLTPFFLEGLYDIENVVEGGLGGPVYLSIDGAFHVLPLFTEGKFGVPVDCASVGFNECDVSVVEATPKVMDCITNYRWSVSGNVPANTTGRFPRLTIALGAHSLHVRTDVGLDNAFELTNVSVGPFYL